MHCKFARALWSEVFLMFGVQWVMPNTAASLLFAWSNCLGNFSSNVRNMIPVCFMWLIWRECNLCMFEDIERPVDLVKSLLVGTLFEWSRIWGFTYCTSMSDFLISVSYSLWFVCIHFKCSGFTIVNTMYFSNQ